MKLLSSLIFMMFFAGQACADMAGTSGSDTLQGTAAAEQINAGAGDDIVLGGKGDDALHGGSGDDELIGGEGNDELFGGEGSDILIGGPGADRFVIEIPEGGFTEMMPDRIFDFRPEEGDVVVLRYLNISDRKFGAENIYLNSRGELRMNISNPNGGGLVDLFRSDLDFKYEVDDREVLLRFKRRF